MNIDKVFEWMTKVEHAIWRFIPKPNDKQLCEICGGTFIPVYSETVCDSLCRMKVRMAEIARDNPPRRKVVFSSAGALVDVWEGCYIPKDLSKEIMSRMQKMVRSYPSMEDMAKRIAEAIR